MKKIILKQKQKYINYLQTPLKIKKLSNTLLILKQINQLQKKKNFISLKIKEK